MTTDNTNDTGIDPKILQQMFADAQRYKASSEASEQRENPDINHAEKLTASDKEIVFDIKAFVFSNNEKGEVTQTEKLVQNKYHIPVPFGANEDEYLSMYFHHVESCLISSTQYEVQNGKTN